MEVQQNPEATDSLQTKEVAKEFDSQLSKEKDDTTSDPLAGLSKRARKRLLNRQTWLASRAERKAEKKLKRKAKIEKLRVERNFDQSYSAHRKRLKQTVMSGSKCEIQIVIDMSFEALMSDRDFGKCLKQLLHCYSINRRLSEPMQFHVTSLGGKFKDEMESKHSGYVNWDCNFHNENYTQVFTSAPYNKAKSDIIYLTSESENVLGDKLDPNKVYIVGGLVDHNHSKGLCHKMAIENGVSHARLPIDEYIRIKTRKVLTIDHVFLIMGKVGSEGKTWREAFLSTLPSRKLPSDIDEESGTERDSESSAKAITEGKVTESGEIDIENDEKVIESNGKVISEEKVLQSHEKCLETDEKVF